MTTTVRPETLTIPSPASESERAAPLRVALLQKARGAYRRHLLRGVMRVLVLLAADLAAFFAVRTAVAQLVIGKLAGPSVATFFVETVPPSFLLGWQYPVTLWLGLAVAGVYGRGDRRRDLGRLFVGVLLTTALVLWSSLWGLGPVAVGPQFLITVLLVWAAVVVERLAVDLVVARLLPRHPQAEKTIFVGDPMDQHALALHTRLAGDKRISSLGWACPAESAMALGINEHLGEQDQVTDILRSTEVDTVVVCGNSVNGHFESIVEASTLAGCRVLSVSRLDGLGRVHPSLVWHRGVPLVELTVPSLKAQQLVVKRVIDVVGAFVGLVLLSPVFAFVALAIKVSSRGPVFFSHERVGFGGRVFRMLKFRTMRVGADNEKLDLAHLNHSGDPRLFKIPNDPRVTRVGAWLRRWSIDEIPQLWNVLSGHMSLVGPRPFFEADLAGYSDHHFVRLGAKPGITGLWQVNGRSRVVDFEEVVRLDREYIDRWSLWLDLKILGMTAPAVVRRTGAY